MSPRHKPGLVLNHSPLLLVLASVEIGPILAIEEKIPQVQEALRKQGYPNFEQRILKEAQFEMSPEHSWMTTKERKVWGFLDIEKKFEIDITTDRLTFFSSFYVSFEEFIDKLVQFIKISEKYIEPTSISRIGLRYVDLIIPSEGNPLENYISPSLRGPESNEMGKRNAFLSQTFITTDAGNLVIRFGESEKGFAVPPDLLPLSISLKYDPARQSHFGLLDLDHAAVLEKPFSEDVIVEKLWQLHQALADSFETCTTDFARNEWTQPNLLS